MPPDQLFLNPNRRREGKSVSRVLRLALTGCALPSLKTEFHSEEAHDAAFVSGNAYEKVILAKQENKGPFYPYLNVTGKRLLYSWNNFYCSPTPSISLKAYCSLCTRCFSGNKEIPRGRWHRVSPEEIHITVGEK